MSLSAVILAGGKSSRMGQDKSLLPFGGYSTLAEYQYNRLKALFNKVYISSKSNKFNFKANIIYDKYKDSNPLNAIISALETLDDNAIFFISVDTPFLSKKSIKMLQDSYLNNKNYDIYLIKSQKGYEPLLSIYTKKILKIAKALYEKNDYKLQHLIENSNYKTVNINEEKEFLNLNKKEEYEEAKRFLIEHSQMTNKKFNYLK